MAPVECSRYNQSMIVYNAHHTYNIFLTKHRVAQLPTDNTSITAVPGVITDGSPESTETNLYCSLSLAATSQSDLTLSTVGWNCQNKKKTNKQTNSNKKKTVVYYSKWQSLVLKLDIT